MNKIRYPRSSARPIYFTVAALGVLGLAGLIVMLIAMADVPRQSYYLLIAAFGMLIVAISGALAVLLATNTRRPWGIDPNLEAHAPFRGVTEAPSDPYGATTAMLLREGTLLPDGPYGRRKKDDPEVVRRLTDTPEPIKTPVLPPQPNPAWAAEMLPPEFRAEPGAEPSAELAASHFPEVPIDQLDLLSNTADAPEPKQEFMSGGA